TPRPEPAGPWKRAPRRRRRRDGRRGGASDGESVCVQPPIHASAPALYDPPRSSLRLLCAGYFADRRRRVGLRGRLRPGILWPLLDRRARFVVQRISTVNDAGGP